MEIKNTFNPLDPYNQTKLNTATQTGQVAGRAAAAETPVAKAEGDRVSFSPEAKLRTEAFTTAMNAPGIRAEKVAALKAQVAAGDYAPDSKTIAAKLLREEPGLFRP